jgi:basic amino acid/polyamine antiporter, APA family
VLLTTLTVLVPYLFSIISFVMIASRQRALSGFKLLVAVLAFLYSMWAIIGAGEETVYWGFVLLMAGLPFYAYIQIKRNTLS